MAIHEKTEKIIALAREILAVHRPMTVRQIYYQLVSRLVIKNNRSQYQAVSNALVYARKENIIPWTWIEDRLRKPRHVVMWGDLSDFLDTVGQSYRRDIWQTQPHYLECWLEKDALSGIFEDELEPYGVTLNVGRGYDGWDSIHWAAERYKDKPSTILYFGDFDPSGEDMVRSLRCRLAENGGTPTVIKCALSLEDVQRYQLPPDFTKTTDTRRKAFVEKFGDISVELDALPVDVLRARLREEVRARIDLSALEETQLIAERERRQLRTLIQQTKH